MQDHERERMEGFVAELSARLRKACAHMSDDDFAELVLDIARMRLKFEKIDSKPFGVPAIEIEPEHLVPPPPIPPDVS